MAHFAELNPEGVVLRVLVVPDSEEHRGGEYLHVDLGLGGIWVQCSYTGRIRRMYPGHGALYCRVRDEFYYPVKFDWKRRNNAGVDWSVYWFGSWIHSRV